MSNETGGLTTEQKAALDRGEVVTFTFGPPRPLDEQAIRADERERWAKWFAIPAENHPNSNTKHTLYDVVDALRANKMND